MSKKSEEKLLFKAILPESFHVQIHKAEEGGYWAKLKEIPCYSQGESLSELFDILTRAIYAFYNVPEKFIREFGTYFPVASFRRVEEGMPQKRYVLEDILGKNPEKIRELQRI